VALFSFGFLKHVSRDDVTIWHAVMVLIYLSLGTAEHFNENNCSIKPLISLELPNIGLQIITCISAA
jgi:hypothetical protein